MNLGNAGDLAGTKGVLPKRWSRPVGVFCSDADVAVAVNVIVLVFFLVFAIRKAERSLLSE